MEIIYDMSEKVSIITISFNSEQVIEKTIKSVLGQSYRPLEYVFVDGASKDKTVNRIKEYIPILEEKGIEVKFISEPDKGISDAFNKGIIMATGSIIGITNADDAIAENAIEEIASNFPQDIDVYYGNLLWVDNERGISYIRKSSENLRDLKIRLKILHPATYVRRSAYEKYGVYNTDFKYCMDKELLARMQRKGAKFQYCDQVFSIVTAGGVSDKNLRGVIEEGKRIAVENGIPKIAVEFIFWKNSVMVKLKALLKKSDWILRLVSNKKGSRYE